MKSLIRWLLGLHLFVGVGAVFGGLAAILNPQNPLGAPVEMLRNSPFSDFFIPGLILFAVIGLGNIAGATTGALKAKYQGYVSGILGCALAIWIVVQCMMIETVALPHVLFFAIGLVQAALALVILFRNRQFPMGLILNIYEKLVKGA